MREIKFRAYGGRKKPWGVDSAQIFEPFGLKDFPKDLVETDWSAIMQFTGLKDKNGKEGFEKDLVKLPEEDILNVIEYNENDGQFVLYPIIDGEPDFEDAQPITEIREGEIIGNIYQNKELLKS